MLFISVFFILLSILFLGYLVYSFSSGTRLPILIELFFIAVFGLILLIFLFPGILKVVEDIFGIQSAINFILYLSIFVTYVILFILYQKSEKQRIEITKLTREIALMNKKKK